ncbi:hypothetical protein [Vulgatibacter sp.]|uniref:hypothetical protein n=1 Tax=Vulgatibacter sp. TaxID=1971226 RepID=UPI003567EF9C
MITWYWDFAGPNAEGTARHFRVHLDEFLAREGIEGCETGVESQGPGHAAAFCRGPASVREPIERALRPRRSA